MTVGGVTTDYAYDGTMLVREFQINQQTGLLAPSVTYMAGPMGPCCRINEQNQSEGYYPAGVTSTTPLTRGVTRWYVYDGLGSKIAELDDNNNMTTSGQYDVYGAPRTGTQQGVAGTSGQGYVGSLGHVTDQTTGGLIYMQARYYDPSLGRFVSQYPKQNGNNLYTYCDDRPTCEADQTGQSPLEVAAVILAAIIGGILECMNHGWSFSNFMLGAVEAGLTAAAGIFIPAVFGLALGGIIMGAAMGALDAEIQGGNVGSGAFWGGLGGSVGGLAGEAELAEGSEQMLCYLLLGGGEAFLQNDGQTISEFVNS